MTNTLYYGDNLDVLRRHVADESVDLVYLDPPFKSNQDYNVLFQEQDGSRSASQIRAFEDTWQWDQSAAAAFEEVVEAGGSGGPGCRRNSLCCKYARQDSNQQPSVPKTDARCYLTA